MNYDSPAYTKKARQRQKYIALDDGESGAFLIDRRTGDIFGIKAYGVPNKRKHIGNILGGIKGETLFRHHWW